MASYTCLECGQTKEAPPSTAKKRKYCSWECRLASGSHACYNSGIAIYYPTCDGCGRMFVRQLKRSGRHAQSFCSMDCRSRRFGDGSKRTVDKVALPCQRCGATLYRYPSAIRKGRGKYCSRACSALAIHPQTVSKIATDSIDRWALSEAVIWVQEYICGPYSIDLVLPMEWIAVELDGEYWHSLPHAPAHDGRKDTYLKNRGWTVVRVPMAKKDTPDVVSENIIKAIKKVRRDRRRRARKGA